MRPRSIAVVIRKNQARNQWPCQDSLEEVSLRELLANAALLCVRTLLVWLISTATFADDDVARLQSAVVKVTSNIDGLRATGAGVIVKVEPDTVFILSATHVVRGDKYPLIEFFSRRNVVVEGDVVERDREKDQGLVLLVVRGKENFPLDVQVLPIAAVDSLSQGDDVTSMGFPANGGQWSVTRMTVSSRQGRNILLSGTVDEGNSGGPVLRRGEIAALMLEKKGEFGISVPGHILLATLRGWPKAWANGCQFTRFAATTDKRTVKLPLDVQRLYQHAETLQDEKRFADAILVLKEAAGLGDFVATTDLAFLTWSGIGVPENRPEALRLFNSVCKEAIEGQPLAQAAIGRSYLVQHPWLIKDDEQGMAWMKAAAEQGQAETQVSLGSMYLDGKRFPQDFGEAVRWYQRAAEAGNVFGQYNLARMYSAGRGVDQNLEMAVAWYRKAAAQGLVGATSALGIAHLQGLGAPRDDDLAAKLLLSAARSGEPNAQYHLATMLAAGRAVPRDVAQAVDWWRKSAKQGDKRAQQELSRRGVRW